MAAQFNLFLLKSVFFIETLFRTYLYRGIANIGHQ